MQLGELLISRGLLDESRLSFALEIQKSSNMKLGDIFINNDIVPEFSLYSILADQWGVPFLSQVSPDEIDNAAIMKSEISPISMLNAIRTHLILPLSEGRIATSDIEALKDNFLLFGYRHVYIVPPSAILSVVELLFLNMYSDDTYLMQQSSIISSVRDFVDLIIRRGIQERASDIHFEPGTPSCHVRFRIDGDLRYAQSYKAELHSAVVNVIMMASSGNPPDERTFEEASYVFEVSRHVKVSIRVSKAPTEAGQSIALRILKQDLLMKALNELGFSNEQTAALKDMMAAPHGIILVAGPTGSGKSTTLHALVGEVKGTQYKVISIEDPVEIKVPFLEQVSVNEAAGITFDFAIKSDLRRDPDVILVGEIRDPQTAKVAFEAALTGHLVLASVHANTIFDTFLRLAGLGVKYDEMSNIIGITNQDLVKRECREEEKGNCRKCMVCSGFFGRKAVGSVMLVNEDMKKAMFDLNIGRLAPFKSQSLIYQVFFCLRTQQ